MINRRVVVARWESQTIQDWDEFRRVLLLLKASHEGDRMSVIYESKMSVEVLSSSNTDWLGARFLTFISQEEAPAQYDPSSGMRQIQLTDGTYFAQVMHVVFTSSNHMIYERHDGGPTLGDLSQYFRFFAKEPFTTVSLYNRGLLSDIEDLRGQLRKIEIALTPEKLPEAHRKGLIGNLVPLAAGERVPKIEIQLGMGRLGRADSYLDPDLQELAMQLTEVGGEFLEKLKLRGRRRSTGKLDEINVLRNRLGDHVEFTASLDHPNIPDSEDAFKKMNEALNRYRSDGSLADAVAANSILQQ